MVAGEVAAPSGGGGGGAAAVAAAGEAGAVPATLHVPLVEEQSPSAAAEVQR